MSEYHYYEFQAIDILVDLRDLAGRDGSSAKFQEKINLIYEQYPTLKGLHDRLKKKGLHAK